MARNIISGNFGNGVALRSPEPTMAFGSMGGGTFIGTDVTGTHPVANVADGV